MLISDTLFCHRVALTNVSAWSLNKFYIIQRNVALRIIPTRTLKYKLQQNTSKWKVYSKRAIIKVAWENSRHFGTLPLVSGEMTSEKRAQKFHIDDVSLSTEIWVELLIGRVVREICFGQSDALPRSGYWVTRHQYGISALVSQTSFRGEASGGVICY